MPTQFDTEKELCQPRIVQSSQMKSPRIEAAKKVVRAPVTPRSVNKEQMTKATVIPAHQISLTRETTVQVALKKEFESVTGRKIPRTRNQNGLGMYGTKYASPGRPLKMLPKTEVDKLRSSSGSQQRKMSPSIRIINTERK